MPHTRQGRDNPARTSVRGKRISHLFRYLLSATHRPHAHVAGTAHADKPYAQHHDGSDVDQKYQIIQGFRPGKGTDVTRGACGGRLRVYRAGQQHADHQSYHPADDGADLPNRVVRGV